MDTDTYGFNFPSCVTGIVLPNGITKVQNSNNTFCSFPNLQTIVIPEGVTSICEEAFRECTNLTSITIPSSVTSIGDKVFYGCTGLKTINYTETEEQWNAISKDCGWNEGCPSDMVINYNYQG